MMAQYVKFNFDVEWQDHNETSATPATPATQQSESSQNSESSNPVSEEAHSSPSRTQKQNRQPPPATPATSTTHEQQGSEISQGSTPSGLGTSSVADFFTDCCTLSTDVCTKGADLIIALATWRRVVGAPAQTATWQELTVYLKEQGCLREIQNGSAVWYGIALKPDGP
jgi:hypothetical protein